MAVKEALLALGIVAILVFLILTSVARIPESHIAVVTAFGRRTRRIKRAGLAFLPLGTLWAEFLTIDLRKRNEDFASIRARARDYAELEIGISLTWSPNDEYALVYVDAGAEDGVRTVLRDVVSQKVRAWAATKTWSDALRGSEDAAAFLVRELGGPAVFDVGRQVGRLAVGEGQLVLRSLGIKVSRLSVGETRLLGDLGRAAEAVAGMSVVREIAEQAGLSQTEVIELLQIKSGQISKVVQEMRAGISRETLESLRGLVEEFKRGRGGSA